MHACDRQTDRQTERSQQELVYNIHCVSRTNFVKRIVNVWNSLPDCIVMSNSVVAFRQKLKQMHFSDFCNT